MRSALTRAAELSLYNYLACAQYLREDHPSYERTILNEASSFETILYAFPQSSERMKWHIAVRAADHFQYEAHMLTASRCEGLESELCDIMHKGTHSCSGGQRETRN